MESVSIGRIVHYVMAGGEHRPAVIVQVWPGEYGNDEVKDGVNLMVLLDGLNDRGNLVNGVNDVGRVTLAECQSGTAWRTSVRYGAVTPDGSGMLAGFWHWPERKE